MTIGCAGYNHRYVIGALFFSSRETPRSFKHHYGGCRKNNKGRINWRCTYIFCYHGIPMRYRDGSSCSHLYLLMEVVGWYILFKFWVVIFGLSLIILQAHSISSKDLILSPSYCSYSVLVTELIIVMTDSDPIP